MLPVELLDEGVAGAIEELASRYAPAAGHQQAGLMPVTVTDVRTLSDYARVTRYLSSLQQVGRVHTSRVEADRIIFELDVKGSPEGIAQTIALGNVLIPRKPVPGESSESLVSWSSSYSQVYQLLQ